MTTFTETESSLITIPRYLLVGVGCEEHHEYEIEINVCGVNYTIYRRYKKFIELREMVEKRYLRQSGKRLPVFPPKVWFNNKTEWVAEGMYLEKHINT